MEKRYALGQTVFLRQIYTDQAGTFTNPASVVCRLLPPVDKTTDPPTPRTELRPAVSNTAPGIFVTTFVVNYAGTWHVRWEGQGNAIQAADEFDIQVRTSPFAT